MKNVLIRNVDDEIVADYKKAAVAHGRSLTAELRDGLVRARPHRRLVGPELVAFVHRLWESFPESASMSDSTALIREDRDSR